MIRSVEQVTQFDIEPTIGGQPSASSAAAAVRPRSLEDAHIDDLLRIVVEKGASDLHLCAGVPPVIRVDGRLIPTNYEKATPQDTQRLMYDILTDEQIQRFESTLELDFSYSLGKMARFRVNVYRDRGAVAAAFRLIPTRIPTIRELNLPPVLEELTRLPRGLIIVTGPTGSGKSTTQAAMINQINMERSVHIVTIEDPIEYLHTHRFSIINQRELGQDTKSFHNALRAVLREDPDVILVGEMRDPETIALAITAAETGHLVIATLHTNSAASTVDRIVDVFPPGQQEQVRIQLSNSLQAVICQQLLPRAGQPGRVPAVEVMIATPAIRNLIRENKAHQITSVIQTSGNIGMQTMDQSLRDLYMKGWITLEEALSRAMNPDELKKMITPTVMSEGTIGVRGR
ncbi:MAG: type IV pilus twitching motility protein PilT [Armatimonadota bacterium]|nr:type IV pilus twitching motility protein PilT [Armatimonadota bacterium]MDW8290456.1 type IV pilus twitching motility protein PilT [Armatimonadota bacterium]